MKGYCFLILAVAFLMYFQKEPVFTVIILGIGIAVYLFFKARKSGKGIAGLFGGNELPNQQDKMNDLMTLIVFQQLLSNSSNSSSKPVNHSQLDKKSNLLNEDEDITSDRTTLEREILELFDKYDAPKSPKKR